jgi:transcriptional regulator with XRE-family HTH domain
MQLTSNQAAELLGISGGALRQIETNVKPVSLHLAYRAEQLYKQVDEELTVDDLIIDEDPKPAPKPEPKAPAEPKVEPTAPPSRRNGSGDRKGPPRAESNVAAGAA